MVNILVTGCNGFIAQEFIRRYRKKHCFIGIDIISHRGESCCHKEYILDIRDTEKIDEIIRYHNITCIVHTAAQKSLIICENNQPLAKEINFDATCRLAELAARHQIKFVFISSDQVFGGSHPYSKESDPTDPINYYGKLKEMAESVLVNQKNCVICRTALVFGDIPEEQQSYFNKVKSNPTLAVQGYIVQQVKHCLKNQRRIILPADEFATPTHVSLLAEQIDRAIESDVEGILHCCGKERISRYNMGLLIAETYGLDKKYILSEGSIDPLRPKDVSLNSDYTEQKLQMHFLTVREMLNKYMAEK